MDAETAPLTGSSSGAGYDFHDPAFVTWWLNSLYLFPVEDQVAIAQRLLSALHAPASRREVEAFLEVLGQELEPRAAAESSQPTPTLHSSDVAVWRLALRDAWHARPWLTGLGLLACALLVIKGIWFLLRDAVAF